MIPPTTIDPSIFDKDKVRLVVITGATDGIGRAMALEFARYGCVIAGCGRKPNKIKSLKRELGSKHMISRVDLRSEPETARWARRVLDSLGVPHLLINNAGVVNRPAIASDVPKEKWDEVIEVNARAPWSCICHFVPSMIKERRGVVVNMSSRLVTMQPQNFVPYTMAKNFLENLTFATASQLHAASHEIAAVVYCPGVVDTNMLRMAWGGESHPAPKPEEWARWNVPWILGITLSDNGLMIPGLDENGQIFKLKGEFPVKPQKGPWIVTVDVVPNGLEFPQLSIHPNLEKRAKHLRRLMKTYGV
jgi:NAD(P)-dependent dehydrogenase (short-subunit alcohol dehydrogenase family)